VSRVQVVTDFAAAPKGIYSQGIVANGFLYTSGMGPNDPVTGEAVGATIEEQTTVTLNNIAAVLAVHNLDFNHVVKATVHLQHLKRDFAGFNATYEKFVVPPYPVRTTVGSDLADILVEIDVIAALPN
jgi:2-iminobutanoate/2-iminopropanoate deaminase